MHVLLILMKMFHAGAIYSNRPVFTYFLLFNILCRRGLIVFLNFTLSVTF